MQPSTEQGHREDQGFYRPVQPTSAPALPTVDPAALANGESAQDFDDSEAITWQASEYIHRSKDIGWIAGFIAIVLLGLSASLFFQQWVLAALIVVMAVTLGMFAFRQPKVKQYTLTHQSLKIDDRDYPLHTFRSFGIIAEEAFYSITLIPVRRFMPAVIVYFAQEDGEKIVDILGSHLPLEDVEPDPLDTLMRRLHF